MEKNGKNIISDFEKNWMQGAVKMHEILGDIMSLVLTRLNKFFFVGEGGRGVFENIRCLF